MASWTKEKAETSAGWENVVVVMIFRSIAIELKLAVHHIEAVEAHVTEQVVVKAQQMLALGRTQAHPAKIRERALQE
jgi:hypothetical protein